MKGKVAEKKTLGKCCRLGSKDAFGIGVLNLGSSHQGETQLPAEMS
jgi:hypothetical protein